MKTEERSAYSGANLIKEETDAYDVLALDTPIVVRDLGARRHFANGGDLNSLSDLAVVTADDIWSGKRTTATRLNCIR